MRIQKELSLITRNINQSNQINQIKSIMIDYFKSYDYIAKETEKQGKLPNRVTLYGNGSIHNYDKVGFNRLFNSFVEIFV